MNDIDRILHELIATDASEAAVAVSSMAVLRTMWRATHSASVELEAHLRMAERLGATDLADALSQAIACAKQFNQITDDPTYQIEMYLDELEELED